jgi:hypothetical protein
MTWFHPGSILLQPCRAVNIQPEAYSVYDCALAWSVRIAYQGCESAEPVCPHPYGMLSDATHNSGLTLSTRFVLPDPLRRREGVA